MRASQKECHCELSVRYRMDLLRVLGSGLACELLHGFQQEWKGGFKMEFHRTSLLEEHAMHMSLCQTKH
eukprot:6055493-Amphidinium_carterae.2